MSTSELPDSKQSNRARIPRWTAPILWAVGIPLSHIVMPWGIARLSARHGWVGERPGLWNVLALILVAAGLVCVIWCVSLHFIAAPNGWAMERTPRYMLVKGPYQFTRNPMYFFELVMWLGWTLFYGSVAVWISFVVFWVVVNFVVRREERDLEARFGEGYRQYKAMVPRWFGMPRR